MSKILSHAENGEVSSDLEDILGGKFSDLEADKVERLVVGVARCMRRLIADAMETDRVGVRELARKMKISPAAVSRQLRSEGDLRISTAVMLADALGRHWNISLENDHDISIEALLNHNTRTSPIPALHTSSGNPRTRLAADAEGTVEKSDVRTYALVSS